MSRKYKVMSGFVIKCTKRERHTSHSGRKAETGDSYHDIMELYGCDCVKVVSNHLGHTVTGYANSGAVAVRETVPLYATSDRDLEPFEPEVRRVIIENMQGKTTQMFSAQEKVPVVSFENGEPSIDLEALVSAAK